MKTKAVLDTNVIISGVFWKGAPFEVLDAWQKRRFLLVISPPILAALGARADYVVSGDAALLKIKNYQGVQTVRPRQFLASLPR